ncbi:MAG: DUF2461 domain-containing protein [Anaerolineales bacterium]
MSKPFPGFPPAGIQFLSELGENNNKEWFTANKSRFEQDLLEPAVAFVAAVGEGLRAFSPAIQVDLRTNGSGTLMRIYRDVRFSKDKSPYKTSVAGMWWEGQGKKTHSPAYGFHLESRGMDLMAGMFQFDKDQLKRYREAVVDPARGAELRQIVGHLSADSRYRIMGEQYKRTPRGYDPEHPNADLLLYDSLYVRPNQAISIAQVTSPQIVEICLSHFQQMAPVQKWLVGLLG